MLHLAALTFIRNADGYLDSFVLDREDSDTSPFLYFKGLDERILERQSADLEYGRLVSALDKPSHMPDFTIVFYFKEYIVFPTPGKPINFV